MKEILKRRSMIIKYFLQGIPGKGRITPRTKYPIA